MGELQALHFNNVFQEHPNRKIQLVDTWDYLQLNQHSIIRESGVDLTLLTEAASLGRVPLLFCPDWWAAGNLKKQDAEGERCFYVCRTGTDTFRLLKKPLGSAAWSVCLEYGPIVPVNEIGPKDTVSILDSTKPLTGRIINAYAKILAKPHLYPISKGASSSQKTPTLSGNVYLPVQDLTGIRADSLVHHHGHTEKVCFDCLTVVVFSLKKKTGNSGGQTNLHSFHWKRPMGLPLCCQ